MTDPDLSSERAPKKRRQKTSDIKGEKVALNNPLAIKLI
jgi:hypothetical protein